MTDLLLVAVGALALLVSALGGWPLAAGVLRLAARSQDAGGEHSRTVERPGRREVLRPE